MMVVINNGHNGHGGSCNSKTEAEFEDGGVLPYVPGGQKYWTIFHPLTFQFEDAPPRLLPTMWLIWGWWSECYMKKMMMVTTDDYKMMMWQARAKQDIWITKITLFDVIDMIDMVTLHWAMWRSYWPVMMNDFQFCGWVKIFGWYSFQYCFQFCEWVKYSFQYFPPKYLCNH